MCFIFPKGKAASDRAIQNTFQRKWRYHITYILTWCGPAETAGTTWLNKAPEVCCVFVVVVFCFFLFLSAKILWEARHRQLRLEYCSKHIQLLPTGKSFIYMLDESMTIFKWLNFSVKKEQERKKFESPYGLLKP